MKIISSEYKISAVSAKQYPEDALPEIALAGRSNVGKSSLINKLLNRKNLARTSGQPGKTRALNFYLINNGFYFVDLPGYGFAKVSKSLRSEWAKFIEAYLMNRNALRGMLHLIDIRHEPTKEDLMMSEWMDHLGLDALTILTKADKLSRNKQKTQESKAKKFLHLPPGKEPVVFSAETGQGADEIWHWIKEKISAKE